jgi:hypothetical protein
MNNSEDSDASPIEGAKLMISQSGKPNDLF